MVQCYGLGFIVLIGLIGLIGFIGFRLSLRFLGG